MIEFDDDVNVDEVKGSNWFFLYGQFLLNHPEPKSYTLRQVDITHETLESAYIHDILEPVFRTGEWETLEEHDRIFAVFSVAQRRLYAVWWYQAQVRNGGHQTFYGNSYGMLWQDALAGLTVIGAHHTKEILLDSIARFAEPPSRHRRQRNDQVDGLDFHDLDSRLFEEVEDLDDLMRKYMLAHPEDFLFSGQLSYENPSEFNCRYGKKKGFRWERLTE